MLEISLDFGTFLPYLAEAIIAVFLLIAILYMIRWWLSRRHYAPHQVFLVRLPKEKPKDQEKNDTTQQLKEEIAKGETIFSAIGGLKAEQGIAAWFLGRHDQFSLEIVASQNRISFYVVAPPAGARYLEQQIHAHYPDAVIEEVEDYNSFSLNALYMLKVVYLRPKTGLNLDVTMVSQP